MKFKIFAGLVVILLLTLAVAQTRYEQKLFSASFPAGGVELSTDSTTSTDGQKITINSWNIVDSGAIYSVSYTDFQTERNPEELDKVLAGEFSTALNPVFSKGNANIGKLAGRSASGYGSDARDNKKLYIYTRTALTEDHLRLWQTMIVSLEPLSLVRINSFFDSVVIK